MISLAWAIFPPPGLASSKFADQLLYLNLWSDSYVWFDMKRATRQVIDWYTAHISWSPVNTDNNNSADVMLCFLEQTHWTKGSNCKISLVRDTGVNILSFRLIESFGTGFVCFYSFWLWLTFFWCNLTEDFFIILVKRSIGFFPSGFIVLLLKSSEWCHFIRLHRHLFLT